jgi:RHS repeat-associated protein
MTKPLKTSRRTSSKALFLRKGVCLHFQKREKPLKTTPAVAYRGDLFEKKFTGKETDPETGLYYYGARYLDPKTSRWLSGDPALGDYLPVAPLDDEEKKRNANLPGMGGVFNYVNLHVYHYAGNNPVKYVDPDGSKNILARVERAGITESSAKFVREVLGIEGEILYRKVSFFKIAGNSGSDGVSLPFGNGIIGLGKDIHYYPLDSRKGRNTLIHEIFHQMQYKNDPKAWNRLVNELGARLLIGANPYRYGELSQYSSMNEMPSYESQAEMVGNFAMLYYDARYGNGLANSEKTEIKDMVKLLEGAGITTEATQWVRENL